MQAGVDLTEQLEDELLVEDRALDELGAAGAQERLDVRDAAGAEVVEHQDLMAVCRQTVGEVRADESCSTRDQVPQERVPFIGQAEVTFRAYPGPK